MIFVLTIAVIGNQTLAPKVAHAAGGCFSYATQYNHYVTLARYYYAQGQYAQGDFWAAKAIALAAAGSC